MINIACREEHYHAALKMLGIIEEEFKIGYKKAVGSKGLK